MTRIATKILLASASPRRRELLERVGLELEIVPADLDERQHADEPPVAYAERLARQKAERVRRPGATVLGADTIVVCDQAILGKPVDAGDARAMLQQLSGRSHRMVTAYHLFAPAGERHRAVETEVIFRALEPGELSGYVASREWDGKAGGYAVQGLAAAFVRAVNGSYTNVVGLPLSEVIEDLRALGLVARDWQLGLA